MFDNQKNRQFFQNHSPASNLGLLFANILLFALIGIGLIFGIGKLNGVEIQEILSQLTTTTSLELRNWSRFATIVNHLTMFILPAFVYAWLIKGDEYPDYLMLNKTTTLQVFFYSIASLLVAFPLIAFLFQVNKYLPLPEWMHTLENSTDDSIKNMLKTDYTYELVLNIITVALIPAIGEELIFRGILQKELNLLFEKPIVSIIVTAFIFSAIHGQFEGFLSRFVLGAFLGMIYLWSGTIWASIAAHFVYNGSQVLGQFLAEKQHSDLSIDENGSFDWPIVLSSTLISAIFLYQIYLNKVEKVKEI